jgi:hypothetical protein
MMLLANVERVYILSVDLSIEHRSWEMPEWPGRYWLPNKVVGTCNGIICMCDIWGGILLHNPVTHEMLPVSSLPPRYLTPTSKWHKTYNFTHDQETGKYMAVHVPC